MPHDGDVGDPDEEPPFAELDEAGKAALRTWLADKKVELQAERSTAGVHFAASFRGSSWTASKRGVGSDVAIAQAMDGPAAEWASVTCGNKMTSFSLKKYDEEIASAFACVWADRMEFMYSCHQEGRLVDGRLSPELRAELPQPIVAHALLAKSA